MAGLGQYFETSDVLKYVDLAQPQVPATSGKGARPTPDKPTYQRQEAQPQRPKVKPPAPTYVEYEFVRDFENRKTDPKGGWDSTQGRWMPHVSLEGGAPTIGYGHKMLKDKVRINGQEVDLNKGITDEQARALFGERMEQEDKAARKYTRLNRNQQRALASLTFNVKPSTWRKSRAKQALDSYQKTGVAEFLKVYEHEAFDEKVGFTNKGLLAKRRAAERKLHRKKI